MSRRECAHCRQVRRHIARGLCSPCYAVLRSAGELDRYPTTRHVPTVVQVDRFDWVVVDRLMAGKRAVVAPSERDATFRELVERGMSVCAAGEKCGLSGASIARMVVAA